MGSFLQGVQYVKHEEHVSVKVIIGKIDAFVLMLYLYFKENWKDDLLLATLEGRSIVIYMEETGEKNSH